MYSSMIFRRSASEYRSLGLKQVRTSVKYGSKDALLPKCLKELNALGVRLPEFSHDNIFYLFSVNLLPFGLLLLPFLLVSQSLVWEVSLYLRMRSVHTKNIQFPFEIFKTEKTILLNRLQKCCQIFKIRVFDVDGCGYRFRRYWAGRKYVCRVEGGRRDRER